MTERDCIHGTATDATKTTTITNIGIIKTERTCVLEEEVCDREIKSVLLQNQVEEQVKPICNWPESLYRKEAEKLYNRTRRECLTVV